MTKAFVIFGFVIAFAAGLVVGVGTQARHAGLTAGAGATTRPGHGPEGWLDRELNLTQSQRDQMRKIWSDSAFRGGRELDEKRRELRREREDAIAGLVHPEDMGKFDQIMQAYAEKNNAIERESRGRFEKAVEETKRILTDSQRQKYEQILARREAERAERAERDRPGSSRGATTKASGK